jgi:uncharacterized protein YjlB
LNKAPYLFYYEAFGSTAEGYLITTQAAEKLPFAVKRVFWLHQVPADYIRGHHAHYTTEEVLIALQGSITITTETQAGKQTFILDSPKKALYLPALCWVTLTFSPDALLLCLASQNFAPADYIRDYTAFQKIIRPTT